jgi:3'-phosphoadenosine 5'-phosphosulfate sulfotransferase (PAPS reductase)/FAD synthetase
MSLIELPNIHTSSSIFLAPLVKPTDYDKVILWFSGGKDSVACYLSLLESGFKPEQIELHHHLVDGSPDEKHFMDWAITEDYCRAFAKAFGSEIYFSWKEGGFEREMLRDNDWTAPIVYEDENHNLITSPSLKTPKFKNTRLKFPQQSASLSERYCSSYLKVDVGDRLIRKQVRFANGKKYLVISGERAQESSARAKYKIFETARSDNRKGKSLKTRRWIDQYRLVHQWQEEKVWEILKAYGVNPHPAYLLGFSRTSCMFCIFLDKNYLATLRKYAPDRFEIIASREQEFGIAINRPQKNKEALFYHALADLGTPMEIDKKVLELALQKNYTDNILLSTSDWKYPIGAFKNSAACGTI